SSLSFARYSQSNRIKASAKRRARSAKVSSLTVIAHSSLLIRSAYHSAHRISWCCCRRSRRSQATQKPSFISFLSDVWRDALTVIGKRKLQLSADYDCDYVRRYRILIPIQVD